MPWNWHGYTKHNWQNAGFNPLRRDDFLLKAEVSSRREPRARDAEAKIADKLPSTDRAEVLGKTPEKRLRWLQKVLLHIATGEISNTTLFDIVTHSKFNAGASVEVGRHMREVITKNLDVFSEKQRRFFQSDMNTLNEFPDAPVSSDAAQQAAAAVAEDSASSDREIAEEPEQIKKAAPGRGLRAVLFRSIEDADKSSRAAPSNGMPIGERRSDNDLRNMSSEEIEAQLQKLRRMDEQDQDEDEGVAQVRRTQQGSTSSVSHTTAAPAPAPESSHKPAPSTKRPQHWRAALAAAQRESSPRQRASKRRSAEAADPEEKDHPNSDDSDADRDNLRNKSTDELLAELAELDSKLPSDRSRRTSAGHSVGSTARVKAAEKHRDRSPLIGKAHIPGRAYRTGCTYLPGQSPSPERHREESQSPVAAEPVRESKSQTRRRSGKDTSKDKSRGQGRTRSPACRARSRSRQQRSRGNRKRKRSSSSSPGVGGFDSVLPDIKALRAAQKVAAERVEALCTSAAANSGKDLELLRSVHRAAAERVAALACSSDEVRGAEDRGPPLKRR